MTKECKTCKLDKPIELFQKRKLSSDGRYNGDFNYGWDLDHIILVSTGVTKEEIIELNNYTNLQPLCSKINRDIKKDKL